MKLIYWNTKNFEGINVFIEICTELEPDIFFLSETSEQFVIQHVNQFSAVGYEKIDNPGCEKVIILAKKTLEINLGLQSKYFTNISVNNLELVSVHFPSQMNYHLDALKNHLLNFRKEINVEIGNSSDTSILIIGDLNVNPFEAPMINFDGFMATNSFRGRDFITNIGDTREPYYNPTWKLYADNEFPGTKKFPRPSASSFDIIEFHFLDQVLISQKLKNELSNESISTLKKTTNYNFYNPKYNRVELSDHLPIVYEFNLKENELEKI